MGIAHRIASLALSAVLTLNPFASVTGETFDVQTMEGFEVVPLASSLSFSNSRSFNLTISGLVGTPSKYNRTYTSNATDYLTVPSVSSLGNITVSGNLGTSVYTSNIQFSSGSYSLVEFSGTLSDYWYLFPSYRCSFGSTTRYFSGWSIYQRPSVNVYVNDEFIYSFSPTSNSYGFDFVYLNPGLSSVSLKFVCTYSSSYSFTADYTYFYTSASNPTLFYTVISGVGTYTGSVAQPYNSCSVSYDVKDMTDTVLLSQILQAVQADSGYNQQSASYLSDILSSLRDISGYQSPMEKFENAYLEKFDEQISKTEDFISPSNPVLPNNGDVAGFVNDISDGLGLSGSSFSAAEFSDATSAFSGSSATGSGGPWEFFSQEVANSLAGGTSAVGLNDDDYIYAWMDDAMRRYSKWR